MMWVQHSFWVPSDEKKKVNIPKRCMCTFQGLRTNTHVCVHSQKGKEKKNMCMNICTHLLYCKYVAIKK